MDHIQWTDAIVKQIQSEHREQAARIRKVAVRLGCDPGEQNLATEFANARALLIDLRDHLADHFAREENGGFLDEAIAHMPSLATAATAVEKEPSNRSLRSFRRTLRRSASGKTLDVSFGPLPKCLTDMKRQRIGCFSRGFNEDLSGDL